MEGEEDSFDQFDRDAPAFHQNGDDNVLTELDPTIEKIKQIQSALISDISNALLWGFP